MISYTLLFPKVSAKTVYYCGQERREFDIAHMISN